MKGFFSLTFTRTTRIKILNKNGLDYANVTISLYKSGSDEEKLKNCKAASYNVADGRVEVTKLKSSDVFTEKKDKNWILKKFSIPNAVAGSIIEYTYQIESEFLMNLQSWAFQSDIPHLYSKYTVSIPTYLTTCRTCRATSGWSIRPLSRIL